jgi:hypothetical protein
MKRENKRYFLNWEDLHTGIIYNNNESREWEGRLINTIAALFLLVICVGGVILWMMGIL